MMDYQTDVGKDVFDDHVCSMSMPRREAKGKIWGK